MVCTLGIMASTHSCIAPEVADLVFDASQADTVILTTNQNSISLCEAVF